MSPRLLRLSLGWLILVFTALCLAGIGEADTTWRVVRNVRLLAAPSSAGQKIKTLHKADLVSQISEQESGDYIKVQDAAGDIGWVYKPYLAEAAMGEGGTTSGGVPAGGGGVTGELETSISPSWDKPAPNRTILGSCEATGDGGDTTTNVRKNRTDVPAEYHRVTFTAVANLNYPHGAPRSRLSWTPTELHAIQPYEGVAVSVEGYLYKVKPETQGNGESTNCHETGPDEVDWHIALLPEPGLTQDRALVVETTPRVREEHPSWTVSALTPWITNHPHDHDKVRVSGWLMLDPEHEDQVGQYRCSLWEVHPITKIEVSDGTAWRDLDATP